MEDHQYTTEGASMKVVSLYAMDWGTYHDQTSINTEFKLVKGWIHGQIIQENDEYLALAQQVFDEGDVRIVVTIPKVCIIKRVDHADI